MLNQTLPLPELSISPPKAPSQHFQPLPPKQLELWDENHHRNLYSSSVTELLILVKLVSAGSWTSSGAFLRNKDHRKPAALSPRCIALFQPSPAWKHGHTETSSASPALPLLQNLNSQPKHAPCCPYTSPYGDYEGMHTDTLGTLLSAQLQGAQIQQSGAQQPNPDKTHYI